MHKIIILMYHIADTPKADREIKYCCTPENFLKQMEYLSKSAYALINLDDIDAILSGKKTMQMDSIAVTFDDGFEDFYHNAFPVLKKFNIPATLFMVSERVGQSNDWMHQRGSPKRNMLSTEQLTDISNAGVLIGSHTCTHPKLNEISPDEKRLHDEIFNSKQQLEEQLGKAVDHFAYPFGLYDNKAIATIKQAGYKTACSTRSGFNRLDINPLLLRRIEVYGNDTLWQFKQKLKFGTNDMPITFHLNYYFKRLKDKFLNSKKN